MQNNLIEKLTPADLKKISAEPKLIEALDVLSNALGQAPVRNRKPTKAQKNLMYSLSWDMDLEHDPAFNYAWTWSEACSRITELSLLVAAKRERNSPYEPSYARDRETERLMAGSREVTQ